MERKGNGGRPLGFCQKLIDFIVKNLYPDTHRQVAMGMNPKPPAVTERGGVNGVGEKVTKSTAQRSSTNEEGEVKLEPPIITIPVEQVEAMENANVPMVSVEHMQEDKKKKKRRKNPVRIISGSQEKEKNALRDEKSRGKELKNTVSLGRLPTPGRNEGGGSAPEPTRQVERSMSNIDKKVDAFIRERKESFGTI